MLREECTGPDGHPGRRDWISDRPPPEPFGLRRSWIVSGHFIWPEWLIELRVRFHKEGSTKMDTPITDVPAAVKVAGIDIGKAWLLPREGAQEKWKIWDTVLKFPFSRRSCDGRRWPIGRMREAASTIERR